MTSDCGVRIRWSSAAVLASVVACSEDSTPAGDSSDTSTGSAASSSSASDSGDESSSSSTSSGDAESESTAPADSSTGPGSTCGDGEVTGDEECDDSNVVDGDACSSSCTLPFEILWTVSHDGEASFVDRAAGLVIAPDGQIYVVGRTSTTDGGADVWVQQYDPDGTEGPALVWDGADGLSDEAFAVAWTADELLVVTGATESFASGEDIVVLAIEPTTMSLEWSQIVDGPGSGAGDSDDADSGRAIAVAADGSFVVAGQVRVDNESWNAWVGALSADGMQWLWEDTYSSGGADADFARGVITNADQTAQVLVDHEGTEPEALILDFDADGVMAAPTMLSSYEPTAMAPLGDSTRLVVGTEDQGGALLNGRTAQYDGDWQTDWLTYYDGVAHQSDRAYGVAVDVSGAAPVIYTVGREQSEDRALNAWLVAYASDGTPLWSDQYNNDEADLAETFFGVQVDASGDVVVVGYEVVLGQQENAFIRKYRPL